MEFTILNDFLQQSLNLLSIECYQITISGIQHVINENDVIDYSNQFQDEVIEEVYKNLSTIQPQSVQIYFNALFQKIEDYQNNKNYKFYSHAETEKMEHLEWQFNELFNQNSENEELLEIANGKGGFDGYFWREANKRRLLIVERLKSEIEEIQSEYFGNKKEKEPVNETLQSNFNLSLKVTDFTVLNKFSSYFIKLFNINNDIQGKKENEITTYIYQCYKNLESNVNSLFKFSTALIEERTNFSLSIPGNEQREYFLRFYNGIINQRVKDIEEHIWEIIEFILGDTYQKNPNATVTREFYEKETEGINFSLWYFNKEFLIKENTETNNEPLPETMQTNSKDNLSHKQQILLLEKLGVFEIPEIKKLTGLQIGKLFSYLLNRDEKNTNTYLRNKGLEKKQVSMDKDFVKSDKNVKRVNEILKEIGLEK